MEQLVIKKDPGKDFGKGRIEAGFVGLDVRGHSRIRRLYGYPGRNTT